MADDVQQYEPGWVAVSAVGSDGADLSVEHKFFVYDNSAVFWRIEPVFRKLLSHRHKVRIAHDLTRFAVGWETYHMRCGFSFAEETKASLRQCRADPTMLADDAMTREVRTCSTKSMCLFLLTFYGRRKLIDQNAAAAVLKAWLSRVLLPDCAVLQPWLVRVLPARRDRCRHGLHGGWCSHMHPFFQLASQLWSKAEAPQIILANLLLRLTSDLFKCDAIAMVLADLLNCVQWQISTGIGELECSRDPTKHIEETSAKNFRRVAIDEDYKRTLIEQVRLKRKAKSGASVAAVQDVSERMLRYWGKAQVAAFQAAVARCAGNIKSGVITLKEDAARIGQPKEETLVGIINLHPLKQAAYLFNQVVRKEMILLNWLSCA